MFFWSIDLLSTQQTEEQCLLSLHGFADKNPFQQTVSHDPIEPYIVILLKDFLTKGKGKYWGLARHNLFFIQLMQDKF